MKWGILVSVIILALVGALYLAFTVEPPQPPTAATSPENLKPVVLADLPPLVKPANPGGSAELAYQAVFDLYRDHQRTFDNDNAPESLQRDVTDLLIKAMNAGNVDDPFLPGHVKMWPYAASDVGSAIEHGVRAANDYANTLLDRGEYDQARQAANAIMVFGRRLFEGSTRFTMRDWGRGMLNDGWELRAKVWKETGAEGDAEQVELDAWGRELDRVWEQWRPRVERYLKLRPHIGDLLREAREDQDRSFRIESVLKLGVMKYNPGTKGNLKGIQNLIQELKQDKDSQIAAAAAVAEKFSDDDRRALRPFTVPSD